MTITATLQPCPARAADTEDLALTLIASRHNVSPKRLAEPAPSDGQLQRLLGAAAAAPDHGELTPWRFIRVPVAQRHRLAEVFAQALLDRDPGATEAQVGAAREKAYRAPLLLVAIARLGPCEPDTPTLERMVSMGAAIQNLLLAAHAMGFGAGLTSGQAMGSPRLAALCALTPDEVPVCCINIGTVTRHKTQARVRPAPALFFSDLPSRTANGRSDAGPAAVHRDLGPEGADPVVPPADANGTADLQSAAA
jgi:nitroreductase